MPKFKNSSLMIIFLLLFVVFDFIGYQYLVKNLKSNYKKDEKIIFYKLQKEANELLTQLLYEYSQKKEVLRAKGKEVLLYLENKKLDISLDEIHKKINQGYDLEPFDIYITDESLKIVNTTFTPDLGFDLSFAKQTFEKHKKEGIMGISGPIFETFSTDFFSYADKFIPNTNQVLQVSYKYPDTKKKVEKILKLIDENQIIIKSNVFIALKDGYVGDFIFKSFKPHKPNLEKMVERLNAGQELRHKLTKDILEEEFSKDGINYKAFYFLQKSTIFDEAKMVYSVLFSQETLEEEIGKLNILIGFLSILGILSLIALFKARNNEIKLSSKDMFIRHSVHEIKTPLSIIALNNQLRDRLLGVDKYSNKINSAIKTLQNSYDDMSYLLTKDAIDYEEKKISLLEFLEQRVAFFEQIAMAQGRGICIKVLEPCYVKMNEIELTRLIDNNLSNAIKYCEVNSEVEVSLKNNTMFFSSKGSEILDRKEIFKKYKRENKTVGGHGLGLSIVQDICKKYNIKIDVKYSEGKNIFIYTFNCHFSDI